MGRDDGKQLGATSAVLYQEGRELRHEERVLGQTVPDTDTSLRALHAAFDTLTYFLGNLTTRQANLVTISSPSGAAISKALDTSPHDNQEESISFLRRLSNILESYPETNIVLLWLPQKAAFAGFDKAKKLAMEAICAADPADIIEPHSINNQKDSTKSTAIAAWAERWHQSPPHFEKPIEQRSPHPRMGNPHHTFHVTHSSDTEPPAKLFTPNAFNFLPVHHRTRLH